MRVVTRADNGEWVVWRVGRRRLAWQPQYRSRGGGSGLDLTWFQGEFAAFIVLPIVGLMLLWGVMNWLLVLLATAVVWPWRAITGRWLVVAYVTDTGGEEFDSQWVQGRSAADELARRWATEIEQHGRPTTGAAGRRPIRQADVEG
ncbi:hypothetical protein [Actinoplanes sp. OR16]|uniref:hypothetical protein n=1 Tax=Actinoplanes sp. OR16 TaxID=946334 RepID=UPI000FD9C53E|nr:hypothetical protein [Actinoplanes sp. OR16]